MTDLDYSQISINTYAGNKFQVCNEVTNKAFVNGSFTAGIDCFDSMVLYKKKFSMNKEVPYKSYETFLIMTSYWDEVFNIILFIFVPWTLYIFTLKTIAIATDYAKNKQNMKDEKLE